MAVYTTGTGVTILQAATYEVIYHLMRMLLDNSNWTLFGSGDGVSVGGPAVDAWNTPAKANTTTSWMCVKCPGDPLQLLFTRYNSTIYQWRVYVDPLGAYSGGTYNTLPTSASAVLVHEGSMAPNSDTRYHALVETGSTLATAGFVMAQHSMGDMSSGTACLAFIPMSVVPPGETYPWVMWRQLDVFNVYTVATTVTDTAAAATCKSLARQNGSLRQAAPLVWCGGTSTRDEGAPGYVQKMAQQSNSVPIFPIMWGRLLSDDAVQPFYKGMSIFAQWAGYAQPSFNVLSSKSKIVLGNAVFPWDGTTVPLPS
jgi:hypothetical protein